ncbi:MAG: helix-turn-helix domain-containing protein [Solirubrobacteraceae bacterium]|nr:helix-turn-helix domain-containing protein [Solirubrobacteraceae bacterium]
MATQAQRSSSARARLTAAASDLISEHGSSETSVEAIGLRAGMSRGAVNFHFGTKVALVEAVLTDAVTRCQDDNAMPSDLAGLFDDLHRSWLEDPVRQRLTAMLFLEGLRGGVAGNSIAALCLSWRQGTARSLGYLQLRGVVRSDLELGAAAAFVVAAVQGLVAQSLADPAFLREQAFGQFRVAGIAHLQTLPPPIGEPLPQQHLGPQPRTEDDERVLVGGT